MKLFLFFHRTYFQDEKNKGLSQNLEISTSGSKRCDVECQECHMEFPEEQTTNTNNKTCNERNAR
jgi:hypothetical protein